jgi:hypothetical protein
MTKFVRANFVDCPTWNMMLYGQCWPFILNDIPRQMQWLLGNSTASDPDVDWLHFFIEDGKGNFETVSKAFKPKNISDLATNAHKISEFAFYKRDRAYGYAANWWSCQVNSLGAIFVSVPIEDQKSSGTWTEFKSFCVDADQRFSGHYTSLFRIPRNYHPSLYMSGAQAGNLAMYTSQGSGQGIDLQERVTQWRIKSSSPGFTASGPLRDIDPFMILSAKHLAFTPRGESLESAIRRRKAGTLTKVSNDRWTWEIDDTLLEEVRFEFIELDYTVYKGDPSLRNIRP